MGCDFKNIAILQPNSGAAIRFEVGRGATSKNSKTLSKLMRSLYLAKSAGVWLQKKTLYDLTRVR